MTTLSFPELGLADPINRALVEREYVTPTPIQARAIPELLNGRDVLGVAQTGTGKTAAFALPILHLLSRGPNQFKGDMHSPRGLILAPTRELAIQIAEEFRAYGKFLHLRSTVIFGGVNQKKQVDGLRRGVDVIIATPGRLLDLMGQGHVNLKCIEMLVLDEADRMLDMGFVHDVRKIMAAMPAERQSLLFSATMPKEVSRLSNDILTSPVRIEIAPQSTPIERIEQSVHHLPTSEKNALLADILKNSELKRVIVFSRTKHRANRIADYLEKRGISSEAIHGNKSQGARQRALKRFRDGDARVLVATDIAARGIDVDNVTHVINFELPNEPENYVHRIGRTARAGANGAAISFCEATERAYLVDIERLIKMKLTVIGEEPAGMPGPKPAAPRRGRGNGAGNRNGNRTKNGAGDRNKNADGKPTGKHWSKNKSKGGSKQGQRRHPQKSGQPQQNANRKRRPSRTTT